MHIPKYSNYSVSSEPMPETLTEDEKVFFHDNNSSDTKFNNPWGVSGLPVSMMKPSFFKIRVEQAMGHFMPIALGHKRPYLPVPPNPLEEFNNLPTGMRAMWFGHGTVLINMGGVNILTDPVFSTIGGVLKRQVRMPMSLDEIPDIDVVLISHGHADHLCKPSLEAIAKRFGEKTLYLVPKGAAIIMPRACREVVELDWWRTVEFNYIRFTLVPAQHWYMRNATGNDTNKVLWGSWVIEGSKRIFFTGDTGYFKGFSLFKKVFKYFDLAILPMGSYEPREVNKDCHMNPDDSVQAFLDMNARHFLPMHWGTYHLGTEAMDGGIRSLASIIKERNLSKEQFHVVPHGGSIGFDSNDFEGKNAVEAYDFEGLISKGLNIPETIFANIPMEDVRTASIVLRPFEAEEGENIIEEGEKGYEMLYILKGNVEVTRNGSVIGVCGKGDIVGEIALFTKRPRNATVKAREHCEFLIIGPGEFSVLREAGNPVVWNLERTIIPGIAKRLGETLNSIYRELYDDSNSDVKQRKSIISKFKNMLSGNKKNSQLQENASHSEVLKATDLFDSEDEQLLETLGRLMSQQHFKQGSSLFKQGDKRDSAFFIAEGEVSIVIPQRDSKGKIGENKVGGIGPGNAIGLHSLVEERGEGSRKTTYIAEQPTTALKLDKDTWIQLYSRQDRVGSAMRVAVIHAFCNRFKHSGF